MNFEVRKYIKNFRILIFFAIIILVIFGIFKSLNNPEYIPKLSFTFPSDYGELFNDTTKENLVLYETYLSKGRYPISNFYYRNKYSILVYKIPVAENSSLINLIKFNNERVAQGMIKGYSQLPISQFRFSYAWDSVSEAKKVTISFNVGSLKDFVRRDSFLFLSLDLRNIFIKYNNHATSDLIIQRMNVFSEESGMELILYKKRNRLYLIFASNILNNETIPNLFLCKLLKLDAFNINKCI